MKKESIFSGFGKGDLHFPTGKHSIVQASYSSEAVLQFEELYQSHVLLSRLLQNGYFLYFSILLENVSQDIFLTNVLFDRRNM